MAQPSTFISKDPSKPYYGKEVYVAPSGKIQPTQGFVSQDTSKPYYGQIVGVAESGKIAPISKEDEYLVTIGGKSMKVSGALAEKIKGEKFYQDQATGEVYGEPELAQEQVMPRSKLTQETVTEINAQSMREGAFKYLAPVERVLATKGNVELDFFGKKINVPGLGLGSRETVYQNVVKPKLWLEAQLGKTEYEMQQRGVRTSDTGGFFKAPGLRAKQIGLQLASGAFEMITAPIETTILVVGGKTLPKGGTPLGIGKQQFWATTIGTTAAIGIARNPKDPALGIARTTGEAAVLIGASKGLDLVGGKNIPQWGMEDIKYPGRKAETVFGKEFKGGYAETPATPETQAYKGIKFGQKNLIGIEYSAAGNKLKLGTPRLRLTAEQIRGIDFTGYATGTSKTEEAFAQEISERIYPLQESRKRLIIKDLIGSTEVTRSLEKGRLFPEQTKSLSKEGVSTVKRFIQKEKGLAYGSWTAEPQLPKEKSLGILRGSKQGELFIGDIDVQLNVGDIATQGKAKSLLGKLSATDTVRISKQSPSLIESKVGGKWVHAVDIHSIDAPLDDLIPLEGSMGFRFDRSPTVRIESTRAMSLSEFRTRKAASIMTFRETGFAPEPHRLKDIPDLITSQEYLTTIAKPTDLPKVAELKGLYAKDLASFGSGRVPIFGSASSAPSLSQSLPISAGVLFSPPSISAQPSKAQPRASVSASRQLISPSISPSLFRSPSMSVSPSASASPYRSISLSISRSISPSISPPSGSPGSYGGSPSSISPSPRSPPSSPSAWAGSGWGIPGLKAPSLGLPLQLFGSSKGKRVTFKPKYFASVEATAWGITGKKPGKFEISTGLNIRPQLR